MAARKKTIMSPPSAIEAPTTEIVAIKGFNRDMSCRGFKFGVGKTYTHDGPVMLCERGFHAIDGHPLDVFSDYPPASSVYAEVRLSGAIARQEEGDSKITGATITIAAPITLPALIERAVRWVFDRAKSGKGSSATSDQAVSSATSDQTVSSSTSSRSVSSSTGDRAVSSSTGKSGAALSSGIDGRAMGTHGNALFLVHRSADGTITHAWAGIVGRDGIKPNVRYRLSSDGKPTEVDP